MSSLWRCPGILDQTHLKHPTNICWFHGFLVTFKNSTSFFNFFVIYSNLNNPAFWWLWGFWTITQEPDFFRACCFWKKLKDHWHFQIETKKHIHLSEQDFAKTLKTSFLLLFQPSELISTFFKNEDWSLFLLYEV